MPLSDEAKQSLGGAMNLLFDPVTAAVRVLVVVFPDENGDVQLRKDIKGNLQLSPSWMAHLIRLLPVDEQMTIASSLISKTLLTGTSHVDRKTGNLAISWIEVDDSGSITFLEGIEGFGKKRPLREDEA